MVNEQLPNDKIGLSPHWLLFMGIVSTISADVETVDPHGHVSVIDHLLFIVSHVSVRLCPLR
jgi:hypothetical protein